MSPLLLHRLPLPSQQTSEVPAVRDLTITAPVAPANKQTPVTTVHSVKRISVAAGALTRLFKNG